MKKGDFMNNLWQTVRSDKVALPKVRAATGVCRRFVVIAVISVFLSTAVPAPARANCYDDFWESFFFCFDLGKLASWIAQAAIWLADEASAAAMYLEKQLEAQMKVVTPIVSQTLESNIKVSGKQGVLDAKRRALEADESGNAAADSLYPTEGQACVLTHAGQEAAVAASVTDQAVTDLSDISAGRGSGPNADTSSPAYVATEVNDRCKLGFIDTNVNGTYGVLPSNLGCTDLTALDPSYARYIDADTRMSSVIEPLQYPLPNIAHVNANTPDGHLSFVGPGGVTVTPTETAPGLGSELDYAAAYKYCENLQPVLPSPTKNSGTPTTADVLSIREDRKAVSLRTAAAEECFRALAYRTSCPAGAKTSLQDGSGSGANCHDAQVQLCARLTAKHTDGGMELKMEGSDPVYAAALKNCDTDGLSRAMYDAIMAHRCDDNNYAFKVLPTIMGKAANIERIRATDCPAMAADYDKLMELEKKRLNKSVGILMQLRKYVGAGGGGDGRIAK